MKRQAEKVDEPEEELVQPHMGKEQLNIIKSVIKSVDGFGELSNFARYDIAQCLQAKQLNKHDLVISKRDPETAIVSPA